MDADYFYFIFVIFRNCRQAETPPVRGTLSAFSHRLTHLLDCDARRCSVVETGTLVSMARHVIDRDAIASLRYLRRKPLNEDILHSEIKQEARIFVLLTGHYEWLT